MSEFTVRGRFRARDGYQECEKSVSAETQHVGLDHVSAALGSTQGLEGQQVDVHGVAA